MEPNPESTSWNLPQPAAMEQRQGTELPHGPLEQGPTEIYGNSPGVERGSMPAAPQFSVPQSAFQAPQDVGSAVPLATPRAADDDLAAADSDRIEKEWIEKAKKIVDQTRQDPYLQTKGFTELKADYLQKRYNKTLRVGD